MRYRSLILSNAAVLAAFGAAAALQRNFEFVFYLVVVLFLAALVYASTRRVDYPQWLLWLLSAWAWMHMAGGLVTVNGAVLYNLLLVPLIGEPYLVLKFDQAVHAFGFFAATLTMFYALRPSLGRAGPFAVPFATFCAGMGLGALNEVVEFTATVLVPETNVGGYVNTGVDLVANLVGAGVAAFVVRYRLLRAAPNPRSAKTRRSRDAAAR